MPTNGSSAVDKWQVSDNPESSERTQERRARSDRSQVLPIDLYVGLLAEVLDKTLNLIVLLSGQQKFLV